MSAVALVLFSVAKELAEEAKASMPKLNDGETVMQEWLADGKYNRKTFLNGRIMLYQFDFRQRKAVEQCIENK